MAVMYDAGSHVKLRVSRSSSLTCNSYYLSHQSRFTKLKYFRSSKNSVKYAIKAYLVCAAWRVE